MLNWYAVFTKPRDEFQASEALQAKGVEVYLPLIRTRPVNPRARKVQPFFPRYLFARADLDIVGRSALNWTPGVVTLVTADNLPVPVPPELIDALRKRLAEIDRQGVSAPDPLQPGERVVIRSGPLQGMEAIFDARLDGKARARVLVEFLQRQVAVELDVLALQKIDPRALAARRRNLERIRRRT